MKTRFSTLLFILLLSAVDALPQPPKGKAVVEGLYEFQCQQIEQALSLEGDRLADFRELYKEYATASRAMAHQERQDQMYDRLSAMSEEQIEERVLNSFATSKQAIALKEQYYEKFRKFLLPSQIATMYEIERRTHERFQTEMRNRAGGGAGGAGGGAGAGGAGAKNGAGRGKQ